MALKLNVRVIYLIYTELLSYQDVLKYMQMRLRLFSTQAVLITHNPAWARFKKAEQEKKAH